MTPLDLGFRDFIHFDPETSRVYVHASPDPTEKHLYRVPLDPAAGPPEKLTREPGIHEAVLSGDGDLRVVEVRTPSAPPRWAVQDGEGRDRGELRSLQEPPPFEVRVEFTTVGEAPDLHAAVVRPTDFDPGKRYPVIVHVYGGPHAQMVEKSRDDFIFDQWLADQGFLVVLADGRGTPARGRDWERAIRYNFIDLPLRDQVTAVRALGERIPQMDLGRTGIYGWSFGGYFTAMATLRHPELFKAGVSGAPVTDWHDYDTHYTERYIGLPQEAPEAYEKSSVLTYAGKLERPLLVIHGTADDNVYFIHSLKMSDAFFRAGRDHEFLPLSGHTHMVRDPLVTERMWSRSLRFLEEHLGDPVVGDSPGG